MKEIALLLKVLNAVQCRQIVAKNTEIFVGELSNLPAMTSLIKMILPFKF